MLKNKTGLIVWILQLLAELLVVFSVIRLNMLPMLYTVIIVVVLAILLLLTFALFFMRPSYTRGRDGKKKLSVISKLRRLLALILSVLIIIGSVIGAMAVIKVGKTVNKVTSSGVISASIGVYVRADDPAQNITDAADYTFATTDAYDAENTAAMVANINETLGKNITTENMDTTFAMVDSLLDGSVDAMILNEAYADLLPEVEGYTEFEDEVRLLYEFHVESSDGVLRAESINDGTDITTTPFILYLSGSDTRSEMLTVSRSDVNILAVVNPVTKEVLMVNTPRDYYVQTSVSGDSYDKLTHCGIYGIDCSMETLGNLYDVDVNYYAQINFTGFETLVDAVGGVTVNSDVAFNNGTVSIVEGENELNGTQALSFVRERHALAGGDNDRGKNQMKVLKAIIRKASAKTLLMKYNDILDSLQGMFLTDMSSDNIQALVRMQFEDMAKWHVHTYAVVGENGSDYTYSMPGTKLYVMLQNKASVEHASELMQKVINGESLTDSDMELEQ